MMKDLQEVQQMGTVATAKRCTIYLLSTTAAVLMLWALTAHDSFHLLAPLPSSKTNLKPEFEEYFKGEDIHVGMALCGGEISRLNDLKILLKSCVMFTFHHVQAHVFAPREIKAKLVSYLKSWPDFARRRLTLNVYEPYFPTVAWRNLFRQCSSQRLFMHLQLPASVQQLIYIDSDALVLSPLEDMWAQFDEFGSEAQFGMTLNTVTHEGWYDHHAISTHKLYPHGFNSGVLLMDIARIRNDSHWLKNMDLIKSNQSKANELGDQDILNQYLAMFPDRGFKLPCSMNYRTDFCSKNANNNHDDAQTCPGAEQTGVYVLHGSRTVFHLKDHNAFSHVFKVFTEYQFHDRIPHDLVPALEEMTLFPKGRCVRFHKMLYKRIGEYVLFLAGDLKAAKYFPSSIYGYIATQRRPAFKQFKEPSIMRSESYLSH